MRKMKKVEQIKKYVKPVRKIFTEKDFDNLFNELLNIVIERGDYKNRQLFTDISDIYDLQEYILDIQYIQKTTNIYILEITYENGKVDCEQTLHSFYNFFVLFNSLSEFKMFNLIDRTAITQIIIPAVERVLSYCREGQDGEI